MTESSACHGVKLLTLSPRSPMSLGTATRYLSSNPSGHPGDLGVPEGEQPNPQVEPVRCENPLDQRLGDGLFEPFNSETSRSLRSHRDAGLSAGHEKTNIVKTGAF